MNPTQRILAAGLFVVAAGTNIITPLILRYQDRLNLSNLVATTLFCVYVGGILVSLLFAGRLSDRFGRRPIVVPFTAGSALASAILIAGRDSLPVLIAGRLWLGVVSGAVLSVGTAWLNELAEPDADRQGLARVVTTLLYLGFGFGPIFASLYDLALPLPLVVPYCVHIFAAIAVFVAMMRLPETKPADPSVSLAPQLGLPAATRSAFLTRIAPAAVWAFGFPSISFALFPLILRDAVGEQFDVLVSGVTGTLTATAVLLSARINRAAGTPSRALVVAMWLGIAGYCTGITAFVTDLWPLVPVAAIALGATSGVIMNAGLAMTEDLADDSNRGVLNAAFYFAAYCGMAMPVIATLGARLVSQTAMLGIITGVATTAAVALTRIEQKSPAHA